MNSYHDYVIKDGKFIGKFDEMYDNCKDPWMQSTQPNKYSRISGILHLKNYSINSVLECGCGLGYYAEWIKRETNIVPKSIDISPVAINKAKKLFPELDFEVADVAKDLVKFKNYDCIIFSEIIWYILPELKGVLEILKEHFNGKYLIINQVFYKGTQRYGTQYFTDLEGMVGYIPFQLLGKCEATAIKESTIETSSIFQI